MIATYGSLSCRWSQRVEDAFRPLALLTLTLSRRPGGREGDLARDRPRRSFRGILLVQMMTARQVHQDTLAQAAVGDPHMRRRPCVTDRF